MPAPLDRYVPRKSTIEAGRAQVYNQLRRTAHERLDELMDSAEQHGETVDVGVKVRFEQGRPAYVHRDLHGVDKAAG